MSSMKVHHRQVSTQPHPKHEASSKQAHAKHGGATQPAHAHGHAHSQSTGPGNAGKALQQMQMQLQTEQQLQTQLQAQVQALTQQLNGLLGGGGFTPGPTALPPRQPTPLQTDLNLVKARFEAEQNPGLDSDTNYLKAARADLKAYRQADPNSPRVAELETLVKGLDRKVTKEATGMVDDALNTWFQSSGTRADDQTLYRQVSQAESALQVSAPNGSEMEFVKALRSYLQGQLFPMTRMVTV